MMFTVILLFVSVVIAFWISSIAGGGASLIILPLLNTVLPVSHVPFSLTIGTFTSSASRIAVFKKNIYWPLFFWFVPFSIPAVFLGVFCLRYINPVYLQFFIAIFLILNVTKIVRRKNKTEIIKNQSAVSVAVIGFLAGFVSGITGAVGLLFNRFYLKRGLSKEQIIATRAGNEIFIHFIKLGLYLFIGLYSGKALLFGVIIAIASVVSARTLKYILPYVSDNFFHKTGYVAMVFSGMLLMFSTTSEIIRTNGIAIINETKSDSNEWGLMWNDSHFVMERSGIEIEFERSVEYAELPLVLKKEYDKHIKMFDKIKMERVYKLAGKGHYEFYAYKDDNMNKFKFSDL